MKGRPTPCPSLWSQASLELHSASQPRSQSRGKEGMLIGSLKLCRSRPIMDSICLLSEGHPHFMPSPVHAIQAVTNERNCVGSTEEGGETCLSKVWRWESLGGLLVGRVYPSVIRTGEVSLGWEPLMETAWHRKGAHPLGLGYSRGLKHLCAQKEPQPGGSDSEKSQTSCVPPAVCRRSGVTFRRERGPRVILVLASWLRDSDCSAGGQL